MARTSGSDFQVRAAGEPVGDAVVDALGVTVALATADFALSACWAVCLDVGARHAGVITGFMNTSGNLGGLIGPLVVGVMVERWQSWTYPFYVTAGVYVMGAIAWLACIGDGGQQRRVDHRRPDTEQHGCGQRKSETPIADDQ